MVCVKVLKKWSSSAAEKKKSIIYKTQVNIWIIWDCPSQFTLNCFDQAVVTKPISKYRYTYITWQDIYHSRFSCWNIKDTFECICDPLCMMMKMTLAASIIYVTHSIVALKVSSTAATIQIIAKVMHN